MDASLFVLSRNGMYRVFEFDLVVDTKICLHVNHKRFFAKTYLKLTKKSVYVREDKS